MTHYINHSIKERQYICLILNKLFYHLHYDHPELNTMEEAMKWISAIREVDGIMLSAREAYPSEPFCVNTENNYMCFEGEYP
jgi:hypothetical protein